MTEMNHLLSRLRTPTLFRVLTLLIGDDLRPLLFVAGMSYNCQRRRTTAIVRYLQVVLLLPSNELLVRVMIGLALKSQQRVVFDYLRRNLLRLREKLPTIDLMSLFLYYGDEFSVLEMLLREGVLVTRKTVLAVFLLDHDRQFHYLIEHHFIDPMEYTLAMSIRWRLVNITRYLFHGQTRLEQKQSLLGISADLRFTLLTLLNSPRRN